MISKQPIEKSHSSMYFFTLSVPIDVLKYANIWNNLLYDSVIFCDTLRGNSDCIIPIVLYIL